MSEIPFSRLPTVFVRITGKGGVVREYFALVSPGSDYSIIPKVDAYRLGHPEAARDEQFTTPPNLVTGVSYAGYWEAMRIVLEEVEVGGQKVQNVQFVAYDIPQQAAFDVVLGQSLLRSLNLQIDYTKSVIRLGGGA